MKNILITGGAGFIGSHLVRHFVNTYPNYHIYNLDVLTYAGNLKNLKDIEHVANYSFIKADIRDENTILEIFETKNIDAVIHLAAESHVDRSILEPNTFVTTNVLGTVGLLNAAKKLWKDRTDVLFYHVSTDEVFGSLGETGFFSETTAYDPHSPYSASKASSDHFVRAYGHTYHFPFIVSNCSNNYGPFQFPEKLIPLMINNIINEKPLPVYGKGENVRDWLWVHDHCKAIDVIFHQGIRGETYCIGGNNEWKNIDLLHLLITIMDAKRNLPLDHSLKLITYVQDRPGHDLRYAINANKLATELKWQPEMDFPTGLAKTVDWYLENQAWVKDVVSGEYQSYYEKQYLK